MNNFKLRIFVHSDLASFGVDMDGVEYTAPVFYVVAESPNGERWAHEHTFPGSKCIDTPHCERFFVNLAAEAEESAMNLRNRIQGAPNLINWERWRAIDPAYGSIAFMETTAFGGDQYG